MSTLLRNLGGSIGIAWAVNLLHQRTHLHYERLGEHVTHATTPHSALSSLADTLYLQARIISYLDIYWVMGLVALLMVWLPMLFRERSKRRL